eukprot:760499-Hanusia_phi.AAC.7
MVVSKVKSEFSCRQLVLPVLLTLLSLDLALSQTVFIHWDEVSRGTYEPRLEGFGEPPKEMQATDPSSSHEVQSEWRPVEYVTSDVEEDVSPAMPEKILINTCGASQLRNVVKRLNVRCLACSERSHFKEAITDYVSSLSIRSLKNLLAERGRMCLKCKTKADLLSSVMQVIHLPPANVTFPLIVSFVHVLFPRGVAEFVTQDVKVVKLLKDFKSSNRKLAISSGFRVATVAKVLGVEELSEGMVRARLKGGQRIRISQTWDDGRTGLTHINGTLFSDDAIRSDGTEALRELHKQTRRIFFTLDHDAAAAARSSTIGNPPPESEGPEAFLSWTCMALAYDVFWGKEVNPFSLGMRQALLLSTNTTSKMMVRFPPELLVLITVILYSFLHSFSTPRPCPPLLVLLSLSSFPSSSSSSSPTSRHLSDRGPGLSSNRGPAAPKANGEKKETRASPIPHAKKKHQETQMPRRVEELLAALESRGLPLRGRRGSKSSLVQALMLEMRARGFELKGRGGAGGSEDLESLLEEAMEAMDKAQRLKRHEMKEGGIPQRFKVERRSHMEQEEEGEEEERGHPPPRVQQKAEKARMNDAENIVRNILQILLALVPFLLHIVLLLRLLVQFPPPPNERPVQRATRPANHADVHPVWPDPVGHEAVLCRTEEALGKRSVLSSQRSCPRHEVVDPVAPHVLQGVVVPTQVRVHLVLLQQGPHHLLQLRCTPVLPAGEDRIVPCHHDPIRLGTVQRLLQPLQLKPRHHLPLLCPALPLLQILVRELPHASLLPRDVGGGALGDDDGVKEDEEGGEGLLRGRQQLAVPVPRQNPPAGAVLEDLAVPALPAEVDLSLRVPIVVVVPQYDVPRSLQTRLLETILPYRFPERVVDRLDSSPVEVVPQRQDELAHDVLLSVPLRVGGTRREQGRRESRRITSGGQRAGAGAGGGGGGAGRGKR